MGAHGSIPKGQDIEFAALEGSLSMMSKGEFLTCWCLQFTYLQVVLNDVLDFNRMDSGRLESVNRPYPFHTALRSMLVPLKLAADARGLLLETEIDKRIDEVIRSTFVSHKQISNVLCRWQGARGTVPRKKQRLHGSRQEWQKIPMKKELYSAMKCGSAKLLPI